MYYIIYLLTLNLSSPNCRIINNEMIVGSKTRLLFLFRISLNISRDKMERSKYKLSALRAITPGGCTRDGCNERAADTNATGAGGCTSTSQRRVRVIYRRALSRERLRGGVITLISDIYTSPTTGLWPPVTRGPPA